MVPRSRLCKYVLYALSLVFITTICNGHAYAQVSGATVSGTVKDTSGGAVPKAEVAITDTDTAVTRNVVTDDSGFYTAPNLVPGAYKIDVTAPGFSSAERAGITLTVGAQQVLDFTMQVGQVTQTVQVTEAAPTVELASSTLDAEVTGDTVRELPLNGRSWTDLANLQPGVSTVEDHNLGDQNRGFGAQVSMGGGRPQTNNYRLDGISINDYANGGPGSVLGGNLGVDAIQEFSVLTSNYSAEYGKTSGGVVNAITRSGTNQIHGSAYEFIRNSAVDARNFNDPLTGPPAFRRNQFGGAIGGPIRKDKTFFFVDYESIRQALGTTTQSFVLSPNARMGNLSAAAGGPVIVDPKVAAYLALEPLPNGALIGAGDTGFFNFAPIQVVNENFITGRVDQVLSDKDKVFATYSFDNSPSTSPDAFDNVLNSQISRRQIVALEETHVYSPTFVNAIRLGWNRSHTQSSTGIQAINPAGVNPALSWSPGITNATRTLAFGGISGIGGGPAAPQFQYVWNAYQVYDDAFVSKGLHSLKFGATFENDQMDAVTRTADFIGTWSFTSLATFLTNNPQRVRGALPFLVSPRYMRTSIFGAYVQDDWRVRPNLTLNLGLRYEMSTGITETTGKTSNLYPLTATAVVNGVSQPAPRLGAPYFANSTLKNFAPRVGFSWDPFKTGKTAVRGGFGVFDVLPLLYTTITLDGRGAPFFAIVSTSNAGLLKGTFPNGGQAAIATSPGATTLEYGSLEENPKRNYVMGWNLNIQRDVTPSLSVAVGYVGSRGVHNLFRIDDANIVLPTLSSAGYLWPAPIGTKGPGKPVNPGAGAIRYVNWGGGSYYDALQVGVMKKMSRGFQIQGAFTWSKSIDNNSGSIAGDTLNNSVTSLYWFDLKQTKAVSDFNVGRTLVINGTWQIPGSKSTNAFVARATNGWQLGGIFKVNDGLPLTPNFGQGGDPLGEQSSDPWDFPNRLTGPGCATATNPGNPNNYLKEQCFGLPVAPNMAFWQANCDTTSSIYGSPATTEPFPVCLNLRGNGGRNILRGPGLVNADMSLFKNNYISRISESFNVQLRFEVFNIFNRANYGDPNAASMSIFNANGTANTNAGSITGTVTKPRQLQLAVKIVF